MLVMGLGNPGAGYADTRHNVGYRVTDLLMKEPPLRFRRRLFSSAFTALHSGSEGGRDILILRYDGFMNNSGSVLPSLFRRHGLSMEDLVVVVDNMDLPPGTARLRKGGGTAGHNGLKSIVACIGGSEFTRLYIGVGRPAPDTGVVEHVLGTPGAGDEVLINSGCTKSAEALLKLAEGDFQRVAEDLNRRGT